MIHELQAKKINRINFVSWLILYYKKMEYVHSVYHEMSI